MSARPSVSVIVPFAGPEEQLEPLLSGLEALTLAPADEVIVADNRPRGALELERGQVRVHRAAGVCSPGFARNRAAALASGDWLVMIDADTEPTATLLDDYFSTPPRPATALLAGSILDHASGDGIAARHSAARSQMSQATTLERGEWSYAQSANIAVRREAFVRAGGFNEDARAGEDADLWFRLRREGWELEPRPEACVVHRSRETLKALLTQLARHGAGAAWLERRYPGSFPAPTPRSFAARIARHLGRGAIAAIMMRRERAVAELLAAAEAGAFEGGRLLSNRPRRELPARIDD
ncbi:MAG: glycosyltransferase family 2 protein [Solirubrobacteraceae bacterium]